MDDTDRFWTLIERTAPPKGAGSPEHAAALRHELGAASDDELIAFQAELQRQLSRTLSHDLWGVAFVALGGCSDDAFDAFRLWLIAQGRSHLEAALADPERAVIALEPGDEADCEELEFAAPGVFEERHATPFPHETVERSTASDDAVLVGEPWTEEELPQRFPKLHRRFGKHERMSPVVRKMVMRPDPSIRFANGPQGRSVLIEGPFQDAYVDRIRADEKTVRLNYSPGRAVPCDLAFLIELPQIRRVSFGHAHRCDLSALVDCPHVEYLQMYDAQPGSVDFTRMKGLRELHISGKRHREAVQAATQLEALSWSDCPLQDLEPLRDLGALRRLQVLGGALRSSSGLGALQALEELDVTSCPRFERFVEVSSLARLRVLRLNGGKAAPPIDDVADLKELETLQLCVKATVPSIVPLSRCRDLASIWLERVTIEDGRIAFLGSLPRLESASVSPDTGCDLSNDALQAMLAARGTEG